MSLRHLMSKAHDNQGLQSPATNRPPAWLWVLGAFLFALVAAAPLLLHHGFLNTRAGGDSPFLLFRLHQLYTALSEGVFPVRWMPDAAFGLGYPFFNYYAALPYYLAAGFHALGFSYVLSLKLTHLLGFLVAAGGMFAWVRQTTGRNSAALLASAAYTFAPFHMVNVYVRGDSLSEFWAMAWYPLILLALHEAALRPTARRVGLVGLAFGALVMTHSISALIFSPFVAVYALGCAVAQRRDDPAGVQHAVSRVVLLLAAGGLVGLALAAWVWVPALGEMGYAQLDVQTTGYFSYEGHFRAENLAQPGLLFRYEVGGEPVTPFSMGLVQTVLIGVGLIDLLWRMMRERAWWRDGFLLGGLIVSTLMITPLSRPLWDNIPLLPFVQFPWRFLSVQALFGAAVIGTMSRPRVVGAQHTVPFQVIEVWSAPILGVILAVAALGALDSDFISLTDADVTPQRLQWYETFSGNIGTTIRYEYLPVWTNPRPYTSDMLLGREPRARFLSGQGTARSVEAGAAGQQWEFNVAGDGARVALPLLYWPGWRAEVIDVQGERALPLQPLNGLGYVQFDAPPGAYTVRLWLGRTPLRLSAELASLAALIGLVVLWRPRLPAWDWMGWSLAAGVAVSVTVLAVVLRSLPDPPSNPGVLNADFLKEAYHYTSPDGVRFADGRRLLSATVVIEDGVLRPDLAWDPGPLPDVSVALAAPPQQAAQGGASYPAGIQLGSLTPGLYFIQVVRPGVPALTVSGWRRGDLYMAPFIVPMWEGQAGGETAVGEDFGPVRLLSVDAQAQPNALSVTLWWETLQEAARNYAVALRLRDVTGREWAALDTQAGSAGLYPTALWHPGEIVPDNYHLHLPSGTPPGEYTLGVTLYDGVTQEALGQVEIESVVYDHLSPMQCGSAVTMLYGEIGLLQVVVPARLTLGNSLNVLADWVACQLPREAYRVLWTLGTDETTWQVETPLAPGSDPGSWQPDPGSGVLVQGRHRLDVPGDLPHGEYTLTLQLLSANGEPLGQPYQVGHVSVYLRDRTYDVPPLDVLLEVAFGDQLKLWGYSLRRGQDTLEIEVAWGALTAPDADYKFFVHLFDPETEQIPAQIDTMPRGYTYPTSLWMAGEVVVEQLVLDLSDVPPGVYRLALGWYDPSGRLVAVAADGSVWPDGRVILDEVIEIP